MNEQVWNGHLGALTMKTSLSHMPYGEDAGRHLVSAYVIRFHLDSAAEDECVEVGLLEDLVEGHLVLRRKTQTKQPRNEYFNSLHFSIRVRGVQIS